MMPLSLTICPLNDRVGRRGSFNHTLSRSILGENTLTCKGTRLREVGKQLR